MMQTRKPSEEESPSAYQQAGVDIDAMDDALKRVGPKIQSTHTHHVRSNPGGFGGLFDAPGNDHVLVSSIDGVGTKIKLAALTGWYDRVGQDIVNHCVNDILTTGAKPLFFLDYVATDQLHPSVFERLVEGIVKACRANNCALLGGETAEMSGVYSRGEHEVVGTVVGSVPREQMVLGTNLQPGDVLIGLSSSGLHTNGFTLARTVLFGKGQLNLWDQCPGYKRTVADVLTTPHRSYLPVVSKLEGEVSLLGMAHITGGGLIDNVPRMLPSGLSAVIDRNAWRVPGIFRFIQEQGMVETDEMFRVFNMGIGWVLAVHPHEVERTLEIAHPFRPKRIGRLEEGEEPIRFAS